MTAGPAVLVMAKVPRPGSVKTRLAPLLGHEGCARLQLLLVHRAVALARSVAPGATFVAFHPADAGEEMAPLVPRGVVLFPQYGAHLGDRMATAAAEVFASGRRGPLVVIGTDVPTLTPRHLRAAFTEIEAGHDAVFGPACDGGYYLVGLDRALPEVFGIDPQLWGGPQVLAASLARARASDISCGLLARLRDLDTPEDARALVAEPELAGDLRRVLTEALEGVALGGRT